MAGRGALPKEHLQRPDRDRRRDVVRSKVAQDDLVRGPDLPDGDWPDQTISWWTNLRRSPMAQTWLPADWDTLLDTALLHRELWTGNLAVASEIRQRMMSFGTSPESRLRLRIQVDTEAEQAQAATPVPQTDRRRRLLKAVGDGS